MKGLILFLIFSGCILGLKGVDYLQDYYDSVFLLRNDCPASNHGCLNCTTGIDCTYDPAVYLYCDQGGNMVCGENEDSTVVFCSTSVGTTNAVCLCQDDTGYVDDGDYEDPYSQHQSYITCSLGIPEYRQCTDGELFFSDAGGCTAVDDCAAEGNFEIPLMCHKKQICELISPGEIEYVIEDCDDGFIFDSNTGDCVDPLGDPNTVCTTGSPLPLVPNPYACDIFHVCQDNGSGTYEYSDDRCCDSTEIFDDIGNECFSGQCSPTTGLCIEEYWERSTCGRCLTNGTQYATDTPCSRYFFLCVDDGAGTILPELTECPTSLVYDSAVDSCVNYPTCFDIFAQAPNLT